MLDYLFGLKLTSKITSSLFTGAAIYINLVEHPARMQCGTRIAITQFQPSFKRAAALQIFLSSVGSLTAIATYFIKPDKAWLYSGLLMFSTLPYTLIFIKPVFSILLQKNIDKDSDRTKYSLEKWNRLHMLRSAAGLISIIMMFYYN